MALNFSAFGEEQKTPTPSKEGSSFPIDLKLDLNLPQSQTATKLNQRAFFNDIDLQDPMGVRAQISGATAIERQRRNSAEEQIRRLSQRDMSGDVISAPQQDGSLFQKFADRTGLADSAIGRSFSRNVAPRLSEVRRALAPTLSEEMVNILESEPGLSTEELRTRASSNIVAGGGMPVGDSIIDFTGGVGALAGTTRRGITQGVGQVTESLLRNVSQSTSEEALRNIFRSNGFDFTPEIETALVRNLRTETDPNIIRRQIEAAVEQTNRIAQETAPRRFSPDNPPSANANEEVVYFTRTDGDKQYVALSPDVARQFGDNIEVGVLPKAKVRTTGLPERDAGGVRVINRADADEIIRLNRVTEPQAPSPASSQKTRQPLKSLEEVTEDVTRLAQEREILEESIQSNTARGLLRYVSPKTGRLPEVTGQLQIGAVKNSGRTKVASGEFSRRGDDIVTEFGFDSVEDAQKAIDDLQLQRQRLKAIDDEYKAARRAQIEKRRNRRIATSENAGRRQQFRALTERYNLTPTERNQILNRYTRTGNISALTDNQFDRFMAEAEVAGEQVARDASLRGIIRAEIEQRNLQNVEALQEALKLPKLNDMNYEQLQLLDETLSRYKDNDRFLGKRLQETIDRTDLSGARTYREVKEKLSEQLDVPFEDLEKIKVSWYDRFLFDNALAKQNPMYRVMVEKINKSLLEGNIRFASFEDELDDLIRAARNSRPRTVGDFVAPTDEKIFKYLEADDATKMKLQDDMTPEELKAAHYLKEKYEEARQYLIRENTLTKYIKDYVTHIRRSGLEAFRKDGIVAAIKDSFQQYRVDREQFQILNDRTGEVLPLEKFFAFAQKRSGELAPTENVAKASKAYFMAFERKRAFDSVVPELDAYVKILSPQRKTESGLEMDPRLKTMLNQYINTKRGRPVSTFFDPGTPPDVVLRGIVAFTRIIDLGLSIPNFVAANVGEQASAFIQMGARAQMTGFKRLNTKKGQEIVEKYRGLVGRSPWKEINDTSKNFPDKAFSLMLAGFHDASVRANKIGLLGQLTKAEFDSGVVSLERLAQIRLDMNTWRALDNTSSIYGSTSLGVIGTQYKKWAVPILYSTQRNIRILLNEAAAGRNPLKTIEGQQTLREAVLVGTVGLVVYNYYNEEPTTFAEEVIQKSARDALSAVGALDPAMWLSTPRFLQYLQDIEDALRTLITMEEYQSGDRQGELKGLTQLGRLFTPAPVRQIGRTAGSTEGDSSLNELDLGDLDLGNLDLGDLDLGNLDLGDLDLGDLNL